MSPQSRDQALNALQVHQKRSIESLSCGSEPGSSPGAENADNEGLEAHKSLLESFKVSTLTINQFKKPRRNKNLA